MPRRCWLLAVVVVLALGGGPAHGADGVPVAVFDGRGWGHGVGMAQDGALAMGLDGAGLPDILEHFYPGTELAQQPDRMVPVRVLEPATPQVVLSFAEGGEIRTPGSSGAQHQGFPVQVAPGGSVRITSDGGGYRVVVLSGQVSAQSQGDPTPASIPDSSSSQTDGLLPTTTTTTSPPPDDGGGSQPPPDDGGGGGGGGGGGSQPPPAEPQPGPSQPAPSPPPGTYSPDPVWAVPSGAGITHIPAAARRYRGHLLVTARGGPFRVVNHVRLEDYLRGMGEVRDPSWPQASLQAQAVAARSYAIWYLQGHAELCDGQGCQVYLGQQVEYPAMDQAVRATSGLVLTHRGTIAQTVYSANAGGHLASEEEGFGKGAFEMPYLRSAPYPTRDPNPWTVEIGVADVGRRLGYPGTAHTVTASKTGPSGRVLELTVEGDAGPMTADAVTGRLALGLRSNLFAVQVEQRSEAPEPPPPLDDSELGAGSDTARLRADRGADAGIVEPATAGLRGSPWVAAALVSLAGAVGAHGWWRRRLA